MKEKSPLDSLILTYPCPINWDTMDGNERERLCKQCDKKVYNISDMSRKEAEEILRTKSDGTRNCIKFYQRADGTITTDECPGFLRPVRNQFRFLKKVISTIVAFMAASLTHGCLMFERDSRYNTERDLVQKHFGLSEIALYSAPIDPRYGDSGMTASESVQDSFRRLIGDWGVLPTSELMELPADDQVKLILTRQRTIDFWLLDKLREKCILERKYVSAFRLSELETVVKFDNPTLKDKKQEMIDKLEKDRQRIIGLILNEVRSFDRSYMLLNVLELALAVANVSTATKDFKPNLGETVHLYKYKNSGDEGTFLFSDANKMKFLSLLKRVDSSSVNADSMKLKKRMLALLDSQKN